VIAFVVYLLLCFIYVIMNVVFFILDALGSLVVVVALISFVFLYPILLFIKVINQAYFIRFPLFYLL